MQGPRLPAPADKGHSTPTLSAAAAELPQRRSGDYNVGVDFLSLVDH